MGVIECQENRPSRWTCAQEELSVPETSKEGLWGVSGALGRGWRPVGWTQKALFLPLSQHWGCTLVLCVPISGLFLASPLCQDLGQLYLETLSHRLPCQRMGDPHGTPVPLRWSNWRSWAPLFHPAPEVPQLSPDAWGG